MRLGIGPSHRLIIENMYGFEHSKPLAHLREYVEVLRTALWDGKVNHHGDFYNVEAMFPRNGADTSVYLNIRKEGISISWTNSRWRDNMGVSCSIPD